MNAASLLGVAVTTSPDGQLVHRFRQQLWRSAPVTDEDVLSGGDLGNEEVVAALVSLAPDALLLHARAGIPAAVSRQTLQDVGRKHRLYGARNVTGWLLGILRGDVVELGRLQVERQASDLGHALHVPEKGRLVPSDVTASLVWAKNFTGARRFTCTSWLLDPQLARELPESNIAAFAHRFTLLSAPKPSAHASEEVVKFVFRRPLGEVLDPGKVTPRTALERIVVARLRAGEQWSEPTGVMIAR